MAETLLERGTGRDFGRVAQNLFGNVRLDFLGGSDADSDLTSVRLGECRLSRLSAGAHLVFGEDVARHSYAPDAIKLIIQSRGLSEIVQGGRKALISRDAAIIYDPTRPYMLANPEPVELLLLQIPRAALPAETVAGLAQPRTAGPSQLGLQAVLLSLMRSTFNEVERLDAVARASIGQTMAGLVRTMLEADPMSEENDTTGLDLLRRRVEAYFRANLDRSDLSIAEVARRMGCTPRYVFRAFAAEATTPSDYLWNLRLEAAHQRLLSVQYAGQSISEIAFGVGYSSSAHFSRAFRSRYDMAPRDLRREAEGR
ncbi:AraC family transcriptional regulator [Devosia lacusdianchii]|uniref:AraC family transcriptional regulator n=1 Tax=Devosia lacusdianchii TaxID=2917991 RepID=UPI001F061A56|nr:AraC family transcriptional regulator [Devosia sp. JXJ CY 41]